jgi:DNA ligase-1
MKLFAGLYRELDGSSRTGDKVAALTRYFRVAPPADAAWAIHFLSGRRPRLGVRRTDLRDWAARAAGIPDWLYDECATAVGDTAETINLIVPPGDGALGQGLAWWVEEKLLPLAGATPSDQRAIMLEAWQRLPARERFVWNKLVTGAFRVGVSRGLLVRGVAEALGVSQALVEERLMGDWRPTPGLLADLTADHSTSTAANPKPFFLASPLEGPPASLGPRSDWQVEWKWDGIRCQVVRRGGRAHVWTRGEELATDRFPEVAGLLDRLPEGTIIDGEMVACRDGSIMPFHDLQRRIGRVSVPGKLLREVPVALIAYDILEHAGSDIREESLGKRRALLESSLGPMRGGHLMVSPVLDGDWYEIAGLRARAADHRAEGVMLKRLESPYRAGRVRGDWWKWKVDPRVIDAVLVMSRRGSGRRAGLFTDHTFAVWKGDELVPVASAYSGLDDKEIRELDGIIRASGLEEFGPVRTVRPEHVFELAFEGIGRSPRHRSGVALRFPRISRWRRDKPPSQADRLETLEAMIAKAPPSSRRETTGELFPDWPGV